MGIIANFPHSAKIDIDRQKHIINLSKYIEDLERAEQRFPSRDEFSQWMKKQDLRGMRYEGRGFEVRQINKNKYSIGFIESDAWVTYYSTQNQMEFARVFYSKSHFISFIFLLIISLLSFSIYFQPFGKTGSDQNKALK